VIDMTFEELPDFQGQLQRNNVTLLAPFQAGKAYTLLPSAIGIAKRQDGSPDFHLGVIRPSNPMLPPAPYGMLDFRLQADFPMEDGLMLLRGQQPGASLEQANFRDGFVQLLPVEGLNQAAPELYAPVAVSSQGLGLVRFVARLDTHGAQLVKDMLSSITPMRAIAHMEIWGVAPRLPLQVHLDPARSLQYLAARSGQSGQIFRAQLEAAFSSPSNDVPWKVDGNLDQVGLTAFGECMADHVRARFAALSAPQQPGGEPILTLPPLDQFDSGAFDWDLSQPLVTARLFPLSFDPLAAARSMLASQRSDTVLSMETIPSLKTGLAMLSVSANLPPQGPNVLSIGVTVKVPPKVPFRPQQINKTIELAEPRNTGSMTVQLSPKEELEYLVQTFVILQDSGGIQRVEGQDTPRSGEKLDLTVDDFPLTFILVEASDRLLAVGSVTGTLSNSNAQISFSLATAAPRTTLYLPKDTEATLQFEVRSADGSHVLKLGPMPARPMKLDVSSFREYGPQSLDIRCAFPDGRGLMAIDLLPEGSSESPSNITVIALTAQTPQHAWTWFASSPFAPGYRYRQHSSGTPNPWSNVLSPFEPLSLQAGSAVQNASAGSPQ